MENSMTITGARVAFNCRESDYMDIQVRNGRISRLSRPVSGGAPYAEEVLHLHGFLVLPGLINAHDHLEFNLFPRLGRRTYSNAAEWSYDIYQPGHCSIRQQLDLPKDVRLFWGGVKNLMNGVTSASHHNPYEADIFNDDFPVRVVKEFGWAHSLDFCVDFRERFGRTPRQQPFIIHAAEGIDEKACSELRILEKAGMLAANTVLVHGVAIGSKDLPILKRHGVSLVWCPSSNLFMFGRTIAREVLESGLPIALGTDSALTAEGDLIDEIHVARRYVNVERIYDMLTSQAAAILRLQHGEGSIRESAIADLLIVCDQGQRPADALTNLRTELVIVGGRVKLVSCSLASELKFKNKTRMHPIRVLGRGEWLIDCDITSLKQPVSRILGNSFQLARQRVA